MSFTYNQTIEYEDCTRDLNFEAARRWAAKHNTTFEEDVSKREPYEGEHEEQYMKPEGGIETRIVKTPTIKRFFVIGDEPKPYVPTDEQLQSQMRYMRDGLLQETQNKIDRYRNQLELGVETADTEEVYKLRLKYAQYLRDYPEAEDWWKVDPKTFEQWFASLPQE